MNIPETFYIALCVTILMLGIVYWFWTQVQYLQRKVNLLDNVVYEMKTLISNLPGPSESREYKNDEPSFSNIEPNQQNSPVNNVYSAPPESVAGDIEAERMASEIEFESFSGASDISTQIDDVTVYASPTEDKKEEDDLQPGGLAHIQDVKKVSAFSDSSIESPLSSMSIKELRRMAEANNIPGASELRKKDLIKALRDKVGQIIADEQIKEPEGVLSFDDINAPNSN